MSIKDSLRRPSNHSSKHLRSCCSWCRGGGDEETLSDYEKAEETIFHAVEDVEKAIVHAIEDEVDTVFPPPEHKTEEENEAGPKKQKKKVATKE
jgi:hypothetical protein